MGEKISLIIFQRRTGFGMNLALMPPCLVGAGFPFCRFTSISLILNLWLLAGIKGKNWLKKKRTGGKNGLGCRSPVTASLGHMVFPEVVLVRSRHAIHRGVRETRRLRRHTHLPSTNPLLYGGRPILNFAQQPSSVVGDVVLWCSTTLWHTSWLFQLVAII